MVQRAETGCEQWITTANCHASAAQDVKEIFLYPHQRAPPPVYGRAGSGTLPPGRLPPPLPPAARPGCIHSSRHDPRGNRYQSVKRRRQRQDACVERAPGDPTKRRRVPSPCRQLQRFLGSTTVVVFRDVSNDTLPRLSEIPRVTKKCFFFCLPVFLMR